MIDRMVKWFREFYCLDLNEEMNAAAMEARSKGIEQWKKDCIAALTPSPYENRGVYYFYADPGHPSKKMARVYLRPAFEGTYRFESITGTYYFNKRDKGTAVVIVFTEHGKLKRKTVTI